VIVGGFQTAISPTTGVQEFTASLGGKTPKAAVLFLSTAATAGSAVDDASFTAYITDGSTEFYCNFRSRSGLNPSGNFRGCNPDFRHFRANHPDSDVTGAFYSWVPNGIRINFTEVDPIHFLCTGLLFAGDDLQAKALITGTANYIDSVKTQSIGFEAGTVLVFNTYGQFSNPHSRNIIASFGATDGTTQGCTLQKERDSTTPTEVSSRVSTVYTGGYLTSDGGYAYAISIENFTSTTLDMVTKLGGSGNAVGLLALNAPSLMTTLDIPTSTGNHYFNVGVQPLAILSFFSALQSVDTGNTGTQAGVMGVGITTPSFEYSVSTSIKDNVTTSNTESYVSNGSLAMNYGDGTTAVRAAFDSYDATGWTENFTSAPSSGLKWPALVFIDDGGVVASLGKGSLKLQGKQLNVAVGEGDTVVLGTGTLALAGLQPTTIRGSVATLGTGILSLEGNSISVSGDGLEEVVMLGTGSLILGGSTPTIHYKGWEVEQDKLTTQWTLVPDSETDQLGFN